MLIAHRGGVTGHGKPENSLPALQEAIRRGYTHVEVDIRLTRDEEIVCYHDATLWRRWRDRRKLSDLTLSDLAREAAQRNDPGILTIDEMCGRFEGRIGIMLDVKRPDQPWTTGQERRVADEIHDALSTHGLLQEALFIGSRQFTEKYFLGSSRIGIEVGSVQEKVELLGRHWGEQEQPRTPGECYFVFCHPKDVDTESVRFAHERGIAVVVSVNTYHYRSRGFPRIRGRKDLVRAIECGVDGVQIDAVYDTIFPQAWEHRDLSPAD